MDFYLGPTANGLKPRLSESMLRGVQPRMSSARQEKQQHSVTFQDTEVDESMANPRNSGGMEKELRSAIAKLYQNYDFVTDEYDRLFDIVDAVREEYNNTKSMMIYHRYNEYKRLIKNAIRKWRSVEKRSSLAISRKQSNASFAQAINTFSGSQSAGRGAAVAAGTPLPGIQEQSATFSSNLNARLRANKDEATRELYAECTRLEREIFQYKTRNQQIKNILCKLASDYDNSKEHVLHIWGRYKELRQMIKEVILADV